MAPPKLKGGEKKEKTHTEVHASHVAASGMQRVNVLLSNNQRSSVDSAAPSPGHSVRRRGRAEGMQRERRCHNKRQRE